MNNVSTVKRAAPKRRRKGASLDVRKARSGWAFVLPFVIGLLIIYIPIIIDSVKFSMGSVRILQGGGYRLNFVGFDNYSKALFQDPDFVRTLTSGIKELLFDIPAIVIFSLFMAVLLNQKMLGRAAFRAIFFIPVILSTGLIADIDATNKMTQYMSDTSSSIDTGSGTDTVTQIVGAADISWIFASMQVGKELTSYVVQLMNNIYDIINRSGVQMLIFLAGLQAISPSIYESCDIDGATAWETFWKVTIPMVSPMILVNTIYTVIDALTSSTNSVMTFIAGVYSSGSGGRELSSAMSWMYFLMVVVVIAVVSAVLSVYIFYQRRD